MESVLARRGAGHTGSAVGATLIECCKVNGLDPTAWLTNSLVRLADGHPVNSVDDLMPWTIVG